jgi:hypothetical protein
MSRLLSSLLQTPKRRQASAAMEKSSLSQHVGPLLAAFAFILDEIAAPSMSCARGSTYWLANLMALRQERCQESVKKHHYGIRRAQGRRYTPRTQLYRYLQASKNMDRVYMFCPFLRNISSSTR